MNKHKSTEQKLNNCLEFIIGFMLENSLPPNIQQIAAGIGVSIGTARAYLREMHGRKMIESDPLVFCLAISIPDVYYVDNR